jgi:transposase
MGGLHFTYKAKLAALRRYSMGEKLSKIAREMGTHNSVIISWIYRYRPDLIRLMGKSKRGAKQEVNTTPKCQ